MKILFHEQYFRNNRYCKSGYLHSKHISDSTEAGSNIKAAVNLRLALLFVTQNGYRQNVFGISS